MQKSLRTYIHEMPQIRQLMILSDLLSVISPLGWWILSLILPETWATFGLYAYLLMGAMGIFVSFAYIIGHFQMAMFELLEHDNLTVVLNQKAFFRRMDAVYQLGMRY